MARHSSASTREATRGQAGRGDAETRGRGDGETRGRGDNIESHNIDASLKRRARLLITNSSIPKQTRSLIRYALATKDPHLAQVVRRVEGGEMTIERLYLE